MTNPQPNEDEINEILRRMRQDQPPPTPTPPKATPPPRSTPPPPVANPASAEPSATNLPPPPPPAPPTMMFRIGDAPVIPTAMILLAMNVIIYIITGLLSDFNLFTPSSQVLSIGWKQNDLIANGEYWRLFTAMFLHGNLVHIFFNGYALYALGPSAERFYGTQRFLAIYFIAGFAGSISSYLFTSNPSVGASGAIFGLFGALGIFFFLNRTILGEIGRQQLGSIAFFIVINLAIGFSVSGVIDNNAHIGGLIGGALAGWALSPRFVRNTESVPPQIDRFFPANGWLIISLISFGLVLALVFGGP